MHWHCHKRGKHSQNKLKTAFLQNCRIHSYLIRYHSSFFYLWQVTKVSLKYRRAHFVFWTKYQEAENEKHAKLHPSFRHSIWILFSKNFLKFSLEGLTSHFFNFMHLCSFRELQIDPCFKNLFGENGTIWMFVWFISIVKPKLFQKYQLEVFQQTLKLQDKLQKNTTKKSISGNLNSVADGSNLLKTKNVLVFSQNPNIMLDLIHQDLNRLQFDMWEIIR